MEHRQLVASNRVTIEGLDQPDELIFDSAQLVHCLKSTPKKIPNIYYYDDNGIKLYYKLCRQPEYYLMKSEHALLRHYSSKIAEIADNCDMIELGCGDVTRKVCLLLRAMDSTSVRRSYYPIDINKWILRRSCLVLNRSFPSLEIHGIVGRYEHALAKVPTPFGPRLVVCLGSSITNLDDPELASLLKCTHNALGCGDHLLVGVDLHKPPQFLKTAYNDANGVAAETNMNVLDHINRRFVADFDRRNFMHHTIHNTQRKRMESHLRSKRKHNVILQKLEMEIRLEKGELILTEIERKLDLGDLKELFLACKFKHEYSWLDDKAKYGLCLFSKLCDQYA